MKTVYIASTTPFAGKTAIALGVGLHAQRRGSKIAYLKPISIEGYKPNDLFGEIDQDAKFAARVFGMSAELQEGIQPIRINENLLKQILADEISVEHLWSQLQTSFNAASNSADMMIVEGSGTLRDGFSLGINILSVPEKFNLPVILISGWRELTLTLDDIMAGSTLLGERLLGVILNAVPDEAMPTVNSVIKPFMERQNITLYGVLPLQPALRAISVSELVDILDADLLVGQPQGTFLIDTISVGAMSVDSALPIIRASTNTAIITGADRSDMQGAAIESGTVRCLILTGEFEPSAQIIRRAEEQGVAVLSVGDATMDALQKIEGIFGKTPIRQVEKLNCVQAILAEHLDYERLFTDIEGTFSE